MKKVTLSLLCILALLLCLMPAITAADQAEDDDPYYLALSKANFPDERLREAIKVRLKAYVTEDGTTAYVSKKGVMETTQFDFYPFYNIFGVQDDPNLKYTFTSIKGLELFPNLQKLDIRGRFLTALDLSALPSLTWVDCRENKLTSLTVTEANAGLQTLNCSYNVLESLDVSKATGLVTLNCSHSHIEKVTLPDTDTLAVVNAEWSHLSEFTLPPSVNLTELYVGVSRLATLDLTGQTNLKKLDCAHSYITALSLVDMPCLASMDATDNRLATLTLGNLPLLPELKCGQNQLTELTVSNMPLLTKVDCSENRLATLTLSGVEQLSELDCGQNQLTTLDCSMLSNLSILTCEKNQLTTLTLGEHPKLKELHANTNRLTGLDVTGCPALTKLCAAYSEIPTLDLSNCPKVYFLEVAGNRIPYIDLAAHPTALYTRYTGSPDRSTPQRVSGSGWVSGGVYTFDMKTLIPLAQQRVYPVTEGVTIDTTTGIVTLPSALASFQYSYGVKGDYGMVVEVTVTEYRDADEVDDPHYLPLTVETFPDANLLACITQEMESMGLVTEEDGVKYVSKFNARYVTALNLSLDPDRIRWANLIDTDPAQYRENLKPYAFTSLQGLGYFNRLNSLELRQRSLTEQKLSALTSLTYLDCSYNELYSFGVPTSLKTLICSYNNNRGLSVEGLKELTTLVCDHNNMTALSVGPSVTHLVCSNNRIDRLDLRLNTNLQVLRCANNCMPSLDLSQNTKLDAASCDLGSQTLATVDLKQTGSTSYVCDISTRLVDHTRVTPITAGVSYSSATGKFTFGETMASFQYEYDTGKGKLQVTVPLKTVLLRLPIIATQPEDVKAPAGSKAIFSVSAIYDKTYQWYTRANAERPWTKVKGANKVVLTVDVKATSNGSQYCCEVSNDDGSVFSDAATLTVVAPPPVIKTQPKSVKVKSGAAAKFSVKATGTKLSYQWYARANEDEEWAAIGGATKADYSFTAAKADDGRQFRCLVWNGDGEAYSSAATLTVIPQAPVIKTQPKDVKVKSGAVAKFSVKATGPSLSFQWFSRPDADAEWTELTGETRADLSLTAARDANGSQYYCHVSNEDGAVDSSIATLTVITQAPVIKTQPKSVKVKSGAAAKFTVKATGPSLSFQWFGRIGPAEDWYELTGETRADLSLTASMVASGSQYYCRVSNEDGAVDSAVVTLTVTPQVPVIKTQPKSVKVKSGTKAKFSVKATGPNLLHRWFSRPNADAEWTEMTGETKADLNFTATTKQNGMQFFCEVRNNDGAEASAVVTLTVTAQPAKVKTQPKDAKVKTGAKAKFTVKASGPNVSYQWYTRASDSDEWTAISGATAATYTVVASKDNAGHQFRCRVWNDDGDDFSKTVALILK